MKIILFTCLLTARILSAQPTGTNAVPINSPAGRYAPAKKHLTELESERRNLGTHSLELSDASRAAKAAGKSSAEYDQQFSKTKAAIAKNEQSQRLNRLEIADLELKHPELKPKPAPPRKKSP